MLESWYKVYLSDTVTSTSGRVILKENIIKQQYWAMRMWQTSWHWNSVTEFGEMVLETLLWPYSFSPTSTLGLIATSLWWQQPLLLTVHTEHDDGPFPCVPSLCPKRHVLSETRVIHFLPIHKAVSWPALTWARRLSQPCRGRIMALEANHNIRRVQKTFPLKSSRF